MSGCPELEKLDYENIRKNYSRNTINNIKRSYNKILKNKIVFDKIDSHEFNDNLLCKIIKVSKTKLLDNKHSIYVDKIKEAFLTEIYNKMNFTCNGIYFNKKLVAYRINAIYNKGKYCFDAAYSRKFRKYNLGILSMDYSIENSCSKKLFYQCEGTGIDSYKLKFTKKVCKIYNVLYKGNTLKSGLIYKKRLSVNKHIENNFLKEMNEKIPQDKFN